MDTRPEVSVCDDGPRQNLVTINRCFLTLSYVRLFFYDMFLRNRFNVDNSQNIGVGIGIFAEVKGGVTIDVHTHFGDD